VVDVDVDADAVWNERVVQKMASLDTDERFL
jgi:hypothetical protein